MKTIERRIEKLEARLPGLPCKKPGHDRLFIFIKRYGQDSSEVDTQIANIRQCARCKDKLVVVLQHFAGASQEAQDAESSPINFSFETRSEPAIHQAQERTTYQDRQSPEDDEASKRRRRLQNLGIVLGDDGSINSEITQNG